ncbi:MAG: hypothetical protein FJ304_01015 [Planctomycetes bacterium]|nr:hypothetical protein [Planctomycetota bacterium]
MFATAILNLVLAGTTTAAFPDPPVNAPEPANTLVGKWTSLAGNVKGQQIPAGTLKLEFTKDGKMTYNTPVGDFVGTYKAGNDNKVTWEFTKELGGRKTHEQTCVVKGDKLTVSDSDGTTLEFARVKADPKKDDPKAPNNKGKIEGKWSSLAGTVKGNEIPAGTLKLEFTKDGKMTYNTPVGDFEGTYTIEAGDKVIWMFTKELGGSKKHEQKCVIKGDKMTVSDTDGTTLDFERVKKKE